MLVLGKKQSEFRDALTTCVRMLRCWRIATLVNFGDVNFGDVID